MSLIKVLVFNKQSLFIYLFIFKPNSKLGETLTKKEKKVTELTW